MRIGLIGDVHADYSWWRFAMWKLHREGITQAIQVGDFGIGRTNYNAKFLQKANKLAAHYGIEVIVVPGNHEDWDLINLLMAGQRDKWAHMGDNLLLAPRGMRWEMDGVSFVALGGAPSVDRAWRVEEQKGVVDTKYHLWFPGEMIEWEDVEYVVEGGYADVMIGHDAPMNVTTIDNRIKHNPHGFSGADLLYAADGRNRMNEAFRGVSPKTFIHGHYHFKVDEMIRNPSGDYTQVVGLGCNQSANMLGHYDTELKQGFVWGTTADILRFNQEEGRNVLYT